MLFSLQQQLASHPWHSHLIYLDSVDSTNTYAKRLAQQGAPEGTVVIADQQTGGRGRLGRGFSSPAGMGIYLSILLRPNCPPEKLMHLTCGAGVAASDAVTDVTGQTPGIKWTNDLVLQQRKLGGILTELSVENGLVNWAIVGIGINCCQKESDFPEEIRNIAISLGLDASLRPQLTAALIRKMYTLRQELFQPDAIMHRFRTRCITIGQEISILRGDQVLHGVAVGVESDGALTVRLSGGDLTSIASGEVSIRGMYGYV